MDAQIGVIPLLNFVRSFIMMYKSQLKRYSRNSSDGLDSQDEDRLLAEEDAKECQLMMELALDPKFKDKFCRAGILGIYTELNIVVVM